MESFRQMGIYLVIAGHAGMVARLIEPTNDFMQMPLWVATAMIVLGLIIWRPLKDEQR